MAIRQSTNVTRKITDDNSLNIRTGNLEVVILDSAPVITNIGLVAGATDGDLTFTANTDTFADSIEYVVTTSNTSPNETQILNGLDENDSAANYSGSIQVNVDGEVSEVIPGVNTDQEYYAHAVQSLFSGDNGPIYSNIAKSNKAAFVATQQPYPGPNAPVVDANTSLTIDAEHYDTGGEGVAYHDENPGLESSQAEDGGRTGTDVEHTPEGDVGWIYSGEWYEYTINVADAGTYSLAATLSSENTGNTFDLHFYREFEDTPYISQTGISIPNTGNWDTFETAGAGTLTLESGIQRVRIYFHNTGQDFRSIELAPYEEPVGGGPADYSETFTTDIASTGTFENDSNAVVSSETSKAFTFPNNGSQTGALITTGDDFWSYDAYYVPGVTLTNGASYTYSIAAVCDNDPGESDTVRVRLIADNGTTTETIADSLEIKVSQGDVIIDEVAGSYTCGISGAQLKVHSYCNNGRNSKRRNAIHLVELTST